MIELLHDPETIRNMMATGLLLLLTLALRMITLRLVGKHTWPTERTQLRVNAQVRSFSLATVLIGVLIIWGPEIKDAAFSLAALAVATVLATKELILCVQGSMIRGVGEAFNAGDRVSIGAHRGDVINYGLFTTTLIEVGGANQRTGRLLTIPNSVYLTERVINESYTDTHGLRVIRLPISPRVDLADAEAKILAIARKLSKRDVKPAAQQIEHVMRRRGLHPSTTEPQIAIEFPSAGEVVFQLRVPTTLQNEFAREQAIVREIASRHPELLGLRTDA